MTQYHSFSSVGKIQCINTRKLTLRLVYPVLKEHHWKAIEGSDQEMLNALVCCPFPVTGCTSKAESFPKKHSSHLTSMSS